MIDEPHRKLSIPLIELDVAVLGPLEDAPGLGAEETEFDWSVG